MLRFRWLALAALFVALGSCRSREAPAPAASVNVPEAPVPASLLAELSVGNPKLTWERTRLLGGALAQALPSSLPVLLATSLSLPPTAAGSLDETVPMVGALLVREGAKEPDAVFGLHVTSGAELVASLTLGDGAKFRRLELAPRLVRLLPAPGAPEFNGALGVSGNYLLLATRVEALTEAGRFVAEGVAKRARSEPGLSLRTTEKVLAGSLSHALREAWQARRAQLSARDQAEREAKGRAPDFADPQVLLGGVDNTIESWLGVIESSRELTLSLVPEADRLRAELSLLPGAEGAAALLSRELVVGPLAPMLELPAGTRAALLLRGDEKPASEANVGLGPSIAQLFGERLSAAQAERLVKAFTALSRSRHGATALGLVSAPAPALLITCELSEPQAFSAALADVLSLVELSPVKSWLAGVAGSPSLELGAAQVGQPRRAHLRFRRTLGGTGPMPSELYLTWEARGNIGYVSVSPDPKLGLTPFSVPGRLGSSAWLGQAQARLGAHAAIGAYADARLLAPGGPEEAPVFVAFGKQADRILVSLDAAPSALGALSRPFGLDSSL